MAKELQKLKAAKATTQPTLSTPPAKKKITSPVSEQEKASDPRAQPKKAAKAAAKKKQALPPPEPTCEEDEDTLSEQEDQEEEEQQDTDMEDEEAHEESGVGAPETPKCKKGGAVSRANNPSEEARDARLRRVCERKPTGRCHVPAEIHEMWASGGQAVRKELLQMLEESGWNKDFLNQHFSCMQVVP